MCRALVLAKRACGHVWSNPRWGAYWSRRARCWQKRPLTPGGRPHAERAAIEQATARGGLSIEGAILFVTLEPCCPWGKVPPDAMIASGVRRVVCAIQDPDPWVNGGGSERLRDAGIEVSVRLCSQKATKVMSGFFHRVGTGRPELLVVEQAIDTIPDSANAQISTVDGTPLLRCRTPQGVKTASISKGTASGLLVGLADIGLTTIAVSTRDPVAKALLLEESTVIE